MQFLSIGLFVQAPLIEIWYSKLLPSISYRYLSKMGQTKNLVIRCLIDALLFAPFQYVAFYLFKKLLEEGTEISMKTDKSQNL